MAKYFPQWMRTSMSNIGQKQQFKAALDYQVQIRQTTFLVIFCAHWLFIILLNLISLNS